MPLAYNPNISVREIPGSRIAIGDSFRAVYQNPHRWFDGTTTLPGGLQSSHQAPCGGAECAAARGLGSCLALREQATGDATWHWHRTGRSGAHRNAGDQVIKGTTDMRGVWGQRLPDMGGTTVRTVGKRHQNLISARSPARSTPPSRSCSGALNAKAPRLPSGCDIKKALAYSAGADHRRDHQPQQPMECLKWV